MSSVEFLEWQVRATMLADVEALAKQTNDYGMAYQAIFMDKD